LEARNIDPPQHQIFFCLQGEIEMRASDGEKHAFEAGDAVPWKIPPDGPQPRVKGEEELVVAVVAIE
jgi:quercetin dioxygenase-like cupin family protein